jgi:hypothetical protein
MFYSFACNKSSTFIVLFEKSSTLIDLMDLCKDFIIKEEMYKPSLNGLGVLQFLVSEQRL